MSRCPARGASGKRTRHGAGAGQGVATPSPPACARAGWSRTPGSSWVFLGLDRLAGEVGKQQGMLGLENQLKGPYGLDGLPGILGVVVQAAAMPQGKWSLRSFKKYTRTSIVANGI